MEYEVSQVDGFELVRSKKESKKQRIKKNRLKKEQEVNLANTLARDAKAKKQFRFLDLPFELRRKILRAMLVRASPIEPLHKWCHTPFRRTMHMQLPFYSSINRNYTYQWTDNSLPGEFAYDVRFDRRAGLVRLRWIMTPTVEQLSFIRKSSSNQKLQMKLPDTGAVTRSASQVIHIAVKRSHGIIEIINIQQVRICRLFGLAILRTCKQLQTEGSQVLYGDNKFSFNSVGQGASYNHTSRDIRDNVGMTEEQVARYVESMFAPAAKYREGFGMADPLFRFMISIGRRNTALITKIILQGEFVPGLEYVLQAGEWELMPCRPCFSTLMSVHTPVLNLAFTNLRELTLNERQSMPFQDVIEEYIEVDWEDNDRETSDEERVNKFVKKMVYGLPNIHCLHLEGTVRSMRASYDIWTMALGGVQFIKARHRKRMIAQRDRTKDGELVPETESEHGN